MRRRTHSPGFSVLNSLIALAVIATTAVIALRGKAQYLNSRSELGDSSLFREVRASVAAKLVHNTQLFMAKRCVSRAAGALTYSTVPAHPRYTEAFNTIVSVMQENARRTAQIRATAALANSSFNRPNPHSPLLAPLVAPPVVIPPDTGLRQFYQATFNDLLIQSSFGGVTGLGRPAAFWPNPAIVPRNDLEAARKRCQSSQTNILPTDTSIYGCYEIVARKELAFDLSGYSIVKAENGLVEFRMEFIDLTSNGALSCQALPVTERAGVVAKILLYWGDSENVRTVADVFTFSR